MKYKDKLIELIADEDDSTMLRWILKQPLPDHPEIFRELKQVVQELGTADTEEADALLMRLDKSIAYCEEKVRDQKLVEDQLQMALEQHEKSRHQKEGAATGVRPYIIECIVSGAPNAKSMKELAEKIIEIEKESGTFDPEKWKEIL